MKKELVIATRGGALAEIQTTIVVKSLQKIFSAIDIRVKKVLSEGDKDRRTTLWELKSSGFFTSQLEDTLVAGQADIAVHSYKDLPTVIREGLTIGAVLGREYPEDCLVSVKRIESIEELPRCARVGTSSLRRMVQIKRLRNDLECLPVRGNVNTRLRKLERGEFDAIILARAGLERLGLQEKVSIIFKPEQFIPAPAQGALAVEIRDDDDETKQIISKIDDENTRIETTAERMVFSALECGCHAPAGAYAQIHNSQITISAFYCEPDGKNYRRDVQSGKTVDFENIARLVADRIRF